MGERWRWGVGVGLELADANAARAECPAVKARVCIGIVSWVSWVRFGSGRVLRGSGRRLCGVCVGDVLGDDACRALGSARCDMVDGERGPSMAVPQLRLSLLSEREWTD